MSIDQAPYILPELFVGRDSELDEIREILGPTESSEKSDQQQKTLTLSGVAGVGKTQLAIAYAKRFRSLYTSIFWLDASAEDSINNGFRSAFELIYGIKADDSAVTNEDAVARVFRWLSEEDNTHWLLIFDGYTPDHFKIEKFYPPVSHGNILVTTETSESQESLSTKSIHLRPFESDQYSLALLQGTSQRKDVVSGRSQIIKQHMCTC